ncbi:hypothetical protein [Nocardia harenae]|uniref:hypothetical protein n=1 Tax=Nocardia harenae TaxID=358707 RepID=UPI000832EDE0|nr:hypothetical protein [Nocardia harenae]
MSYTPDDEYAVLHGLRIKGMTAPAEIAAAMGIEAALAQEVLDDAVAREHARLRTGGRLQGYLLTTAGRARYGELAATRGPADSERLDTAYRAFLEPNRAFKTLTTRWQTEANGHIEVVLPDLREVHRSVLAVLTTAAQAVPRMTTYEQRFDAALESFASGEAAALARPMSGSYHDVWMELHEDLLLTLGRERSGSDE